MNRLKKEILCLTAALVLSCTMFSCADNKEPENQVTYAESMALWVKQNYPQMVDYKVEEGLYMKFTKNSDAGAKMPDDSSYVYIQYTSEIPGGNYVATTDEMLARQLNTFSFVTNYVPFKFRMVNYGSYYGITTAQYMALKKMSKGDEVEIIASPNFGYFYSAELMYEGFRGNKSITAGTLSHIKMKLVDFETDGKLLAEERTRYYARDNDLKEIEDGLYMKTNLKSDIEADSVRKDSTIEIRYTGYFMNKFVFGTNSKEVAEEKNIYDSNNSYEPYKFYYNEADSSNFGGLISAFKPVIKRMRLGEKATFICYPSLAYGASGKYSTSGTLIFTQTPLIYDIEILKKEEED